MILARLHRQLCRSRKMAQLMMSVFSWPWDPPPAPEPDDITGDIMVPLGLAGAILVRSYRTHGTRAPHWQHTLSLCAVGHPHRLLRRGEERGAHAPTGEHEARHRGRCQGRLNP